MTHPTEQHKPLAPEALLALRISAQIAAGVRHVVFAGAELDTLHSALTAAAPRRAEGNLRADCVRLLPGGKLDDSTYEQIEDALDKIEAPATAADGRWLTLAERITASADEAGK